MPLVHRPDESPYRDECRIPPQRIVQIGINGPHRLEKRLDGDECHIPRLKSASSDGRMSHIPTTEVPAATDERHIPAREAPGATDEFPIPTRVAPGATDEFPYRPEKRQERRTNFPTDQRSARSDYSMARVRDLL